MNKTQVIHIGGGDVFETNEEFYAYMRNWTLDPYAERKSWSKDVSDSLGDSVDYLKPQMPNKLNADYKVWEIWFEKLFPYLTEGRLVLIGHSLGGIFLLQYLSTKQLPRTVDQLHIVAGCISPDWFYLGNFAFDVEGMKQIPEQVGEIHVYHSKDDEVVPFEQGKEIHERLPGSHFHQFTDRGHFTGETFPELIQNIKNL